MNLEELKFHKRKKNHPYYPRTKKEKCESGYNQIMLLSDKEAESIKAVRKICQNTGLLWSVFSRILTESCPYFLLFGQSWKNYPTAGKYGSEKALISAFSHSWVLMKEFWFLVKLETEDL